MEYIYHKEHSDKKEQHGIFDLLYPADSLRITHMEKKDLLSKYRATRGMSQDDLSRALAESGIKISRNGLSKRESGLVAIKQYEWDEIVKVLAIPMTEIAQTTDAIADPNQQFPDFISIAKRLGTQPNVILNRLVEWFATQPESVQYYLLGIAPKDKVFETGVQYHTTALMKLFGDISAIVVTSQHAHGQARIHGNLKLKTALRDLVLEMDKMDAMRDVALNRVSFNYPGAKSREKNIHPIDQGTFVGNIPEYDNPVFTFTGDESNMSADELELFKRLRDNHAEQPAKKPSSKKKPLRKAARKVTKKRPGKKTNTPPE